MVEVNDPPPTAGPRRLTIGQIADRAGVTTSSLRFYEDHGLLTPERNEADHRRYPAEMLRRISFIRTAQRVGLSLAEIRDALDSLPHSRTPNAQDWARLADAWRPRLDDQIALLTRMRDQLDECIGCGCLSLATCGLWNPGDAAAGLGAGPRYLLSDERPDVADARRPPGGSDPS